MECVAGSKMYGLDTPESDTDVRGVYKLPPHIKNGIKSYPNEVADDSQDIKYYELEKFIKLAIDNNPNIIELLFATEWTFISDDWQKIIDNKELFISLKAKNTFLGYAHSQLKRARGKNKKVHDTSKYFDKKALLYITSLYHKNEWTECEFKQKFNKYLFKYVKENIIDDEIIDCDYSILQKPKLVDFCYVVLKENFDNNKNQPGMRPVQLDSLCEYDLSKMDHFTDMYKMYKNGSGAIENNQICLKSISKEREFDDFIGIVSIQQDAYTKALKGYSSFWEWWVSHNKKRYSKQNGEKSDFDLKNFMHCIRLLLSGKNIALNYEPSLKFDKETESFLRNIRNGKYDYSFLMEKSELLIEEITKLFNESNLQYSADVDKINELYLELGKE